MDNTVCIDWLAVTVKPVETTPIKAVKRIIERTLQMEFNNFAFQNWGINRYNCHYVSGDIKVYYSQDERTGLLSEKMGLFIQMTGNGCRQYEEYMRGNVNNWVELVKRFMKEGGCFTRIDIANDIYDESLNVQQVYHYCKSGLCISFFKKYEYHEAGILENGEVVGETVNIGTKGNDGQQLGIYNKLMERKELGESLNSLDSWVRSELRLFGKRAHKVAEIMATRKPLKEIYFGVVGSSYRFVSDDRHSVDKNKRRRSTVQWWTDYITTKQKTSLKFTREKVTLKNTERYLDKQVAKSLAKVYKAKELVAGSDEAIAYILKLLEEGDKKITAKDMAEINQYVVEQRNDEFWAICEPEK
uniref:replication initiation factor domain-containing protein n=1 Tax=Enterococcus faecalis TaxID=1351 RepID=UPI00359C4DD8